MQPPNQRRQIVRGRHFRQVSGVNQRLVLATLHIDDVERSADVLLGDVGHITAVWRNQHISYLFSVNQPGWFSGAGFRQRQQPQSAFVGVNHFGVGEREAVGKRFFTGRCICGGGFAAGGRGIGVRNGRCLTRWLRGWEQR
ncbi:MAG: hypothetical protein M5U34_30385 [Chloroflexi bacterium]|nr:hypothetical protein [Chloroflexota bacterium]